MNAAAATAFALVMLLGITSIAAHTWHDRHTTPTPADGDELDQPVRRPTVYDQTVTAIGNPADIDLEPPDCPAWPTWQTITDRAYQNAITAIANEH